MKKHISANIGGSSADFNAVFGGLHKVVSTTEVKDGGVENQLDYYRKRELQPLDGATATWIHAFAFAFRGGYNMSSEVGIFRECTYDLDLQNCYPTAASCVLDVDYLHPDGVIIRTINNEELSINDFLKYGPLTPFAGFVSFTFPDTVLYPTIPVPVNGSLLYPRSSGEGRGVWVTGPEVWLALKLGAKITCQIGHVGRVRTDGDGHPSRLLRDAYHQLIDDRARAKEEFGAKSFEQSIIKLMANSPYGKLAQGVVGQRGWDSWAQEYDAIGGSSITSPYHASMTTSLARVVLLATLNQLDDAGYSTPSCTTDGFITDAPLDVVEELDQFGLGEIWRDAREALTDSRTMWEQKHQQSDLYNVSTRANFSREPGGVLAHGGYKVPPHIAPDSQDDRDFMYDLVVSRDGALPMEMKRFPSLQELSRVEDRKDFSPVIQHKELALEFDRKRRPVPDGMTHETIIINGKSYEVARVKTVPWETPEEYAIGRSIDQGLKSVNKETGDVEWKRSPVRRTREQWHDYCQRLDTILNNVGSQDEHNRLDRIAKGIVIAQRQGVINIPWLAGDRLLADRLDAFKRFNLPRPSDRYWHHAKSKTERQIDVDLDAIAPYVSAMMSVDPFGIEESEGLDVCPL